MEGVCEISTLLWLVEKKYCITSLENRIRDD